MDLFDLVARITLDAAGYKKGLKDSEDETEKFGDKVKKGLGTVGKVVGAGLTAAATGVGVLGKQAVEAYANYEQLVGGAELMFGDAYDFVAEKAANAYKTVQMSQNDYLRQVNGFATGLKTALGGNERAAAELADKIITAEADVVAATGNTQDAVQNAFNGIMKGNYTMLDNLQLGITPTKEGFQEIIDKVNEWNEANGRATNYQIDNLADAQAALVDYIDMVGVSGYAHDEASKTIQGSLASMKSAWQNLLVGIVDDNADFDTLVGNFTESVSTAAQNIIPRIGTALKGVGKLVSGLAPVISKAIPTLVKDVLPSLLESAVTLLKEVGNAFIENAPLLLSAGQDLLNFVVLGILEGLPKLAESATTLMGNLGEYIQENLPTLLETGLRILTTLSQSLHDNIGIIIDAAINLALAIGQGLIDSIPTIVSYVPTIVSNIANIINDNAPKILEAGVKLIAALIKGLIDSIPVIIQNLPKIIKAIWDTITAVNWVSLGGKVIKFFSGGIKDALGSVVGAAKRIVSSIIDGGGLKNLPQMALQWGKDLLDNFIGGIKSKIGALVDSVKGVASKVKSFLGFSEPDEGPLSNFHTYAPDMMKLFAQGIKENEHLITDQIGKSFDFGNDIANIGLTGNGTANGGTTNTFGAVSISIYPREGQNADEIADAVMERIQAATNRRAAALT